MKSFKLYNGKRDKFSLRKKSVGLVSVAIATLAMYGIVGGSQTVQADEQSSMNSQVTSVSDSSEKTETEKAVVPTPISEDASSVSSSSVSENEIMDAAQSVSGLQSSSTESTSSEDSSPSSSNSSSTEEESSKPSPTPSQSETTPKTEETNTAPQTRAARSRRSVTEALSQISDFKVTVTTKDGTTMNSGDEKTLSNQEIAFEQIHMKFTLTQDGTLKAGTKIRIPVKLVNNAYGAYYSNLGSGTEEPINGVGTIKFEHSDPNNLAYVITLNNQFEGQKIVEITQKAATIGKFTAKSSYENIVLEINGNTFTFKPQPRTFEKAQAPFAVYNSASSDKADSIKLGTSTGDANYYNNLLSSDGKNPGQTGIPQGDIISIYRIKPGNGSKIISIKPDPKRYTSTLAISEDGKYLVKGDTPSSISIKSDPDNKSIDLPANSTNDTILKALKQAGKNSSVVIDNGDGTYTVAINLGKMIGEGATTYHEIWPTDDYAQMGDKYQEINRTEEVNKKVSAILKDASVIQGTGHSTRITFADSSIKNTITNESRSYSYNVDDNGNVTKLKEETISATTTPSNARAEGQKKITIHYVDTTGKEIETQDYQFGFPAGGSVPKSPDYKATPKTIAGYTLVTTQNPITSISGKQLTTSQSIAFENNDQDFYYVYAVNKSNAKVTYIDDTDGNKVLETKELTGDYNTTDSYRTTETIKKYTDQNYELVKDEYPPTGVKYNDKLQTFEVHLKHKTKTETQKRTVKETIRYVYENGTEAKPTYVATLDFTRTATTDLVTNVTTGDWTAENGTSFAAVTSPAIKGYTPDLAEVPAVDNITSDSPNIEKTVVYKANPASAKVTYIDDTTGETLETKDLNGFYGQTDPYRTAETIKTYTDRNYELVSDNYPTTGVTYNETLQTFEVRLRHKVAAVQETKIVTETIKYVYEDNTEAANTKVQTLKFERINTKDLVTNKSVYKGPWIPSTGTFPEVVSPKIDGYTPDKATVAAVEQITGDSADIEETVTYKADKQKVTYTIIDDTAQKTLKDKELLTSGGSDTPLPDSAREKYDLIVNAYLAQGYELVSKEQLPAKFDLDSSYDQNVVVHVKHKVSTSTETKTVTQTINYLYEDDNTPAAPEKKTTLTFSREMKTDEVTKVTTPGAWTPSVGTFPEVISPTVDGYTPDKAKVDAENVTADQADIKVTVKYKADKQKVTYTVIDDTTNTTLKDKELLTSGASDTPLPNGTEAKYDSIVDAYLAQGYELVSKDHLPAKFDLDSSYDQNVVIRLKHKTVSVEETKQVSMTVRYHGAGGQTPADKVQTATWTRTVTTDKVTGSVVNTTDWTSDKANYDAVPSPVIPGYTVDIATVPSEVVTQENIVKDVHYTIQTQKVTYTVVDETTGQTLENQVELTTGDSGAALPAAAQTKYDRIVKGYTDKGYELVSKDDLPAQFDKDSSVDQNVVVHLKHKVTTSSEIKTVKETIHYVYQNGSEARSSYGTSLSFTREVKTDEVTKLSTKGSWSPVTGTFAAVTSPMITGYTADKPIVAAVDGITGDSEDIVETVVYKANQERAQVRYIDDTTGATLETKELTGDYNTTDSYRTADTISHYTSQGYELVSDNYPSTGVIYNETYQKFEVHLKHGTAESQESKKVSLTVRYHGAGSQTPADNVQTATWTRTVTKDKVTGDVVKATDWTADKANYNAIPSPVIPGYTVDVATVPQEKVTQEDIVKDVHYGIQTQKVTYTVIDDTTGTTLENQVELTTGESDSALPAAAKTKYGQVVKGYTDKGYELVSKDELPAKFDLDSSHDQNVTVHLKHGTAESQESKKVSLTVRYHGAGSQTPADNVQTVTWTRTVTKDKVTGDVVKTTDWVADKATYDAVPSPVIPGYTVDVATVSAETVTQEDMVKDVYYTAIPVTPDKPTPPVVPSTPDKPTTPTVVPTTPTKATPTKTEILPSTGDSQVGPTLATLTGVSLLLSAFGYIGRRKKED